MRGEGTKSQGVLSKYISWSLEPPRMREEALSCTTSARTTSIIDHFVSADQMSKWEEEGNGTTNERRNQSRRNDGCSWVFFRSISVTCTSRVLHKCLQSIIMVLLKSAYILVLQKKTRLSRQFQKTISICRANTAPNNFE